MKNDELLKKTQDVASEMLNKGKDALKDVMNKADEIGLTKKAMDAKDVIVDKAKEIGVDKDSFDVEEVKDTMMDLFNKVANNFKDTKKEAGETIKDKSQEIDKSTKEVRNRVIDKVEEIKPGNSKFPKKAASVALASAAAAGAYTLYKKNKLKEESMKAEFSEKMKKWNELSDEDIKLEKENNLSHLKVKSNRIYKLGENAQIGDLVINISDVNKEVAFNPEETSQPIFTQTDIKEKASDIAKLISEKLKELSNSFNEVKENSIKKADELLSEAKERTEESIVEGKEEAIEIKENLEDKTSEIADELKYKVNNVRADLKEDIENAKETLDKNFIEENKMETNDENEVVDDFELKEEKVSKKVYNPAGRNEKIEDLYIGNNNEIKWEEEANVINEKAEEIKNAALKGFGSFKSTLDQIRKTIMESIENVSNEVNGNITNDQGNLSYDEITNEYNAKELSSIEESINEEMKVEEYNVVIHNKGEKDYYFSPTLIQRYNTKTRRTMPTPRHEEGTTLETRVIKPGETYKGVLAISKGLSDDSLIFFEDMTMNSSVTILVKEEIDKDFERKENEDLVDKLLFEDDDREVSFEEINKNVDMESDLEPTKEEIIEVAKDDETASK